MTTIALGPLSQQTIFKAAKPAERDVRGGRRAIGFAHTLLGGFLDSFGSTVVSFLHSRLERDVLLLRGACSFVNEADGFIVDPKHEASRLLIRLERSVRALRASAMKGQTAPSLKKMENAMTKLVGLLVTMEGVVRELKLAITAHDAKVTVQTEGTGQLAYVLPDDQVEQFEECITLEKQPTARMREAARRRLTQVISR